VKEFAASSVRAISPDGTKLCVEDWKERGYPIRVLEIGTWRIVYTGSFEARTYGADFFADSQTVLVGYPIAARAIVDLRTGQRTLSRDAYNARDHQGDSFAPAGDRTLLKKHWQSPPYETTTLSLVELPDYREIVKVPYATETRKPRPVKGVMTLNAEWGPVISDRRTVVAYSFDSVLVCRRMDDLSVLWTKSVEPGL